MNLCLIFSIHLIAVSVVGSDFVLYWLPIQCALHIYWAAYFIIMSYHYQNGVHVFWPTTWHSVWVWSSCDLLMLLLVFLVMLDNSDTLLLFFFFCWWFVLFPPPLFSALCQNVPLCLTLVLVTSLSSIGCTWSIGPQKHCATGPGFEPSSDLTSDHSDHLHPPQPLLQALFIQSAHFHVDGVACRFHFKVLLKWCCPQAFWGCGQLASTSSLLFGWWLRFLVLGTDGLWPTAGLLDVLQAPVDEGQWQCVWWTWLCPTPCFWWRQRTVLIWCFFLPWFIRNSDCSVFVFLF